MLIYERNAVARRHLDARLEKNAPVGALQRPPHGWVKAIREALGMTTAQLARRMGIAQSSAVILEKSESLGRIRLDTLHRAAAALDCRLVYALVPNQPLETMVQSRKMMLAQRQLAAVEQSMRLENQAVEDEDTRQRHLQAISDRVDQRSLWDE
jgi:predicted DNA-binding mobile mystery protein A